jgi:hypothetical protein
MKSSDILTRVGFPEAVYAELSALLNTFREALAIAVAIIYLNTI